MSNAYPVTATGFNCDILTRLCRTIDQQAEVTGFSVVGGQAFGDGANKVSTAGRAELDLTFADGTTRRTVIKLCRPDIALQPLYRNEVAFYLLARPGLEVEAPKCLGAAFDEMSGTFALALEDLRVRGARFPNVMSPVSLHQLQALLDQLAMLHARYWQSSELTGRLAAIRPHTEGELHRFFMSLDAVPALVTSEIRSEQFKREMVEAIGTSDSALYDAVLRTQHYQSSLAYTLCHGDCHIGNTYLLPDGGGLLDWQLTARGRYIHDVSYLIITALAVAQRREVERDLISYYLDRLAHHGVTDGPGLDEAWYEHRLAANWCLYIGWLTTPITHYGWEISVCNIIRLATAVADLGSVALARELPSAPSVI